MEPKLGLALGGGAAKGYAHIGVLKVLEKEKIPISFIAGTSIGGLIGALYAAGLNADMLEKLALNIKREQWIDLTIPRRGLIAGKKIEGIIRLLTKNKTFDQLNIPLAVTATDLKKGEEVVIKEGNVARAVRATISIPGIFNPVVTEDKILVDGGVLNKVPVDLVREMGADYVIAVDLGSESMSKIRSIYDIIIQTFDVMGREILKNKITGADVVVRPKLGHISLSQFNQAEECIKEGMRAALEVVPEIMKLLNK
ncbi:MAG: patatin-like phospholipase family protein [Firmicutes bacterium]|nr:patatin-like phospholipase family protein [Bacillota bacterium]